MEAVAETHRLRSVFPEEIWLLIGKKIAHIHDHLRLRDSSAYFRFLFKNELDRAMFSEVAKILHVQLERYLQVEDNVIVNNVMQKCRLVCRHWAECVDAASENFPIFLHPLSEFIADYSTELFNFNMISLIGFGPSKSITDFWQHFAHTHVGTQRNPFKCRSVSINYQVNQAEAGNHIEQSLQLFREYGQHIWYFLIDLPTTDQNTMVFYRKLYEMLKLMPNLRLLSLSSTSDVLQQTTLNELELHLKAQSFPNFRDLKFLRINQLPTSVVQSLIRANPQIKTLAGPDEISSVMLQERLPQLELFSTVLKNEQQLRVLKNLSFVLPLRHLVLQISQPVSTKNLFEILGKGFSTTLTELKLRFWDYWEFLDVAPLKLPNLQKFSLETICYTPLDFLLPTKSSLKTLSLCVHSRHMRNAQKRMQSALDAEITVKFYRFCDNVLESNIWSIFPNLRSVDYLDRGYEFRETTQAYRRFDWIIKQTGKL